MITLNSCLTPKAGKTKELETTIRDNWINAISKQYEFLIFVALKPFDHNVLLKLGAESTASP